jgi:hypothetical protein
MWGRGARTPTSEEVHVEWFRDCTGFKGRCGNTYIREEELSQQFEEVVRRIQIPGEIADAIAETLRTSQGDKERFHRTAVMRLQQRYLSGTSWIAPMTTGSAATSLLNSGRGNHKSGSGNWRDSTRDEPP